jgi:hypothetical protein
MSPLPSTFPETTYVPAPQPSLALPAPAAPAIPTDDRLDFLPNPCSSVNPQEACAWLQVAWQEADSSGTTIRVYAVTACLHTPTASRPTPKCIYDGDAIPRASLLLLGSAPAAARTFSFALAEGENTTFGWLPGGGPDVYAVVLQAVNAQGGSPFAIAGSSGIGGTL